MKNQDLAAVKFLFIQAMITILAYKLIKSILVAFEFESLWPVKILKIASALYIVMVSLYTYRQKRFSHGR